MVLSYRHDRKDERRGRPWLRFSETLCSVCWVGRRPRQPLLEPLFLLFSGGRCLCSGDGRSCRTPPSRPNPGRPREGGDAEQHMGV